MQVTYRILLVNDDQAALRYVGEKLLLNERYDVTLESSAHAGLNTFREGGFDLALVKFSMPDMEGSEFVKSLRKSDPDCIIIVIVDEVDTYILREITRLGVYDFLSKPISLEKLFFLVQKGLDLHLVVSSHRKLMVTLQEQNMSLQKQNTFLAKRVDESTKNLTKLYENLRQTYMHTIKVLAQAIDARDHYTHSHSENVAKYAALISEEMLLSAEEIQRVREACELHDLGKIGVEDSILLKPSGLTDQERQQIRRHPTIAAQILQPLNFLNNIVELIRQHHEHYDGTGYPEGLKGEEILLGARIIHVADAYEAMTSARSYRKVPLTKDEAVLEVQKNSGTQFDPLVVEAFLRVVDKL